MLRRLAKAIKRGFRGIGRKGYTLLEVAAVVAVTGTLAAVAMPVVADKIAAGKLTAAQSEVQSIRDSILNFIKDTGVPPFYAAGRTSLALPKETDTTFNYVLSTKDGVNPAIGSGTTDWTFTPGASPDLGSASLDSQLIENVPLYPTKGISAWKGPYIPSLKKDPWGNKYLVTIKWLAEPVADTGGLKYQKAVFVISAGPNGIIETNFEQKIKIIEAATGVTYTFLPGIDDIISRIQ